MTSDREKILAAAQQFAEKNQYERALTEYRRLLAVDPNDARILLKVGDLQMRAQDFGGAIATYDRVARFYSDQGFALKAVAVYKQVRELLNQHRPDLQPNFGHVLESLVQLYLTLGLGNDALQTLDEEATRLRRVNQEEAAVEMYRRMTAVSAGAPLPHLRLAEGLCRIGRVEEALTSFWTAAQLLVQADRKDDALRVVERMLHFKSDPQYALVAAKLYLEKRTAPEGMQALSRLQLCFQADPNNLEVLSLLAEAFAVIGQETKALEVLKEIARQAHEQGDVELFHRTLETLRESAPDDEQVTALTQLPPPRAGSRASAHPNRGSLGAPPPKPRGSSATAAPPPKSTPAPVSTSPASATGERSVVPQVPGLPAGLNRPAPSTPTATSHAPVPPPPSSQGPIPPPPPPLGTHPSGSQSPVPPPPPLAVAAAAPPSVASPPSAPPSLPPSVPAPASSIAPERVSRLSQEIAEATSQSLPEAARASERSEVDVDDLDDLDFTDEDSMSGAPLSDAVPRPAAMRPPSPAGVDLQAHMRQTLRLVQQHRDAGRGIVAIEVLLSALEINPRSIELRETLRDLYAENGDRDRAIEEMLTMAAIYLEYSRPDHAETVLRNILEAEPTHARALHALTGLANFTGNAARARRGTPPPARRSTPVPQPSLETSSSVEEALEEAEFFSSRGMYGDARRVILDQLAVTPNNPLLLEVLSDIEQHKTRPRSSPPPRQRSSDFNIKEQLSELERVVRESQKPPAPGAGVNAQVDVEAVFEKFKAGVKAQVADTDSATHYDLGMAYKEMNLLDDAVEALKLAARDPERECNAYAMIGLIYSEQRMWDPARKFYSKALGAVKRTTTQDVTLYYELGHVSEMAGQTDQAAYYFRQVLRRDTNFRDARQRLAKLRSSWAPPPESRTGHDEEVDRAFDELIGD